MSTTVSPQSQGSPLGFQTLKIIFGEESPSQSPSSETRENRNPNGQMKENAATPKMNTNRRLSLNYQSPTKNNHFSAEKSPQKRNSSPKKTKTPRVTLKSKLLNTEKALEESQKGCKQLENELQLRQTQINRDKEEIQQLNKKLEILRENWEQNFVSFKLQQQKQESTVNKDKITIQDLQDENSNLKRECFFSCALNSKFNLVLSGTNFGHTLQISEIWEQAQKENVPTEKYIKFATDKLLESAKFNKPAPQIRNNNRNTNPKNQQTKQVYVKKQTQQKKKN